MTTREKAELANLAVAGELARQLCHELSNVTYNLLLHADIARSNPGQADAAGWEWLQGEGQKLARLLQEWHEFHDRFSFAETAVDVHAEICRVAADLAGQERSVEPGPEVKAGPLAISSSALDCRHLLRLVAEDLLLRWQKENECVPALSFSTETGEHRVLARITATGAGQLAEPGPDSRTLMASACRALAVRVGATLSHKHEPGCSTVAIEFPRP